MSTDRHVLAIVESLYGVLDRTAAAVLLLDDRRRIVFANERAQHLGTHGDGISLSGGQLTLGRKQDDVRLQTLLARMLDRDVNHHDGRHDGGPSAMRAGRASGRRPYTLFVAALGSGTGRGSLRPALCVVITDPAASPSLPTNTLQGVFGLTEAESRLAALLAAGCDLRDAAHRLGVTYGTARAHLAEIFEKTDTRRQGELINLLLTTLG